MNTRELFFKQIAQTSPFPLGLEIEEAEGIYLKNREKSYIDLISGISVSNVGHRHPKVLEAIQNQIGKYLHVMVYGEYILSPQIALAQALLSTLPSFFESVYFCNSGTEAVEGAMKVAKRYTGKSEFISCQNAYHGSTQGALSLMGSEIYRQNYRPLLPNTIQIRHGKIEDLEKITSRTAAVFIEIVAAEAGVRISDKTYFQALRKRCDETETLLVLDEIQTGFGRTGTFWAFEAYDFVPDIVVCAKGMGGGMPIGAFISSKEIMKTLSENPILGHITTFGGHPVSCAASLATLQIIKEFDFLKSIHKKADLFKTLLTPLNKPLRQAGLMMALEFSSFMELEKIIKTLIEKEGIITDWFLFCDNSMRICPPLTITESEIEMCCEKFFRVVK